MTWTLRVLTDKEVAQYERQLGKTYMHNDKRKSILKRPTISSNNGKNKDIYGLIKIDVSAHDRVWFNGSMKLGHNVPPDILEEW